MRIQKSALLAVRSLLKTTTKKLPLAVASIFLLAGGVLLAQNLTTPDQTLALTPPDSCFAFNATTKTITDYYDHQSNNPANPACPRDVDIPGTIGGVAVTDISFVAFGYSNLSSVTVPNSVTTIGQYAFISNQITSATITNPTATLSHEMFTGNPIASMTIGSSTYDTQTPTTDPDCFAISGGTLTEYYPTSPIVARDSGVLCSDSVVIPNSVTSIGDYALDNLYLTEVVIPNSVTLIGYYALGANKLTSITIPNSVTSIGNQAFASNRLTSVVIPDSVISISNQAFARNQLTSVDIPSSITSIGNYVFAANRLTQVTIPSSVISVTGSAFALQTQWGGDIESSGIPGVPYQWSSDEAEIQSLYDAIWYVRLITEDPSNPNNLATTSFNETFEFGEDANADGINNSIGGYIINPAQLTVDYKSTAGAVLRSSQKHTGAYNGNVLTGYMVTDSSQIYGPGSDAVINASYHHIGAQVTLSPPAVDKYVTPSDRTFNLTTADNQGEFIYKPVLNQVDFATPSGSSTNPTAASVPNGVAATLAGSTFTTDETEQCSAIDSAKLLPASNFTAPDSTYTTLGGLDFTLSCTTPGEDAKVSLALASEVSNPTTVKVYKKTADGTVTDITNQTTITNQAGKTTISYSLADGGALDDDGTVNGTITDPIYVTVPLEGNQALLADTGASLWLYGGAAAMLILAAIGLVVANRRILSRR